MHKIDYLPVLSSLIAGELGRLRKCSAFEIEFSGISASTEIGGGDLGTDSLDLLQLASAVDEMFHLHETGVEEYLLRYRKLGDWAEIVSTSLQKKAERITFRTSGSSGKPKPCVHRVADLQQEVAEQAEAYSDCKRILTLVPRHHIYGFLWTILLPQQLGVEILDVRRVPPMKLVEQLRAGDLLVGTPSLWRHVSESLVIFPPSVRGVTSGAACMASLFGNLLEQGLQLTEIYGSSETGGIGHRSSPKHPFTLLSFWKQGASPSLLARRCLEDQELREFEPPDYLEWLDCGRFVVGERRDSAVQVLGMNVYPQHIAEIFRSHPRVKDCTVRLMQSHEGERLKAFVVLHAGAATVEDREELQSWMRTQFRPHERPVSIAFGLDLPRNEMGKIGDWDLQW